MSKNSKQKSSNEVNANNKKKAFKEGEMDNTVKLDESLDQKEAGGKNFIPATDNEEKPVERPGRA